jgi:hypothetical protein
MRRFTIMMLTGIMMLCLAGFAFATSTDDPGIQKREAIQQKRIDQGVKSGQLTPKETGNLERQQTKIKQDEERMKADGKLTPQERRKLKREQNRANRNIYRKKHNEREVNVK